jgi:hypothetical protein
MTDPTPHYPVTPPPPTSPWTPQDPYAPYAGTARFSEPPAGGPPEQPGGYEPYAGGPSQPGSDESYAGGPSGYPPYAGGPGYQGAPYGMPPGGAKPSAYWPLSIVGLLCSLLFGAIAMYYSAQVGRRWNRGDVEGARRASRTARRLGIVAIVVGVIGTAILLSTDAR